MMFFSKKDNSHHNQSNPSGGKVIDLSPVKTNKSGFFHKKAFLFGIGVTLVLAVVTVITGYYFITLRTTTPPKATEVPLGCYVKLQKANQDPEPGKNKELGLLFTGTSGDESKIKVTWSVSTDKGEKGKIADPKKQTTDWTPPDKIEKNQSWVFKAQIKDSGLPEGKDTAICTRELTTDPDKKIPVVVKQLIATNDKGANVTEAKVQIRVTNNSDKKVDVRLKENTNWCKGIAPAGNFGLAVTTCTENPTQLADEIFAGLEPGKSKESIVVIQKVGNTGSCGSAQVDIYTEYRVDANDDWTRLASGNAGVAAGTQACTDTFKYKACSSTTQSCVSQDCPAGMTQAQCDAAHPNQCTNDDVCKVFQYRACTTNNTCGPLTNCPVAGTDCRSTMNKCSTDDECKPKFSYKVCQDFACKQYDCPTLGVDCRSGIINQCSNDDECKQTYKFRECTSNNVCGPLTDCPEKGVDCRTGKTTCTSDAQCSAYTYKTCVNQACVSRQCDPKNQPCASTRSNCVSDSDCKVYTHKVCSNNACVSVACPNNQPCNNECTDNVSCGYVPPNPTHKACVNQSCQVVAGAGSDTCTSDVSCRPAAVAPKIPQTGTTETAIGAVLLGIGVIVVAAILAL